MIIIDSSEKRQGSRMPAVEGSVESTVLESLTGADIMVSAKNYPPKSKAMIEKHIKEGAILIQRKSGRDLASSIGPRLNSSLAKMFEIETFFSGQRVLLTTGLFAEDSYGNCIVGECTTKSETPYVLWHKTGKPYKAVRSAIQYWNIRGGVSTVTLSADFEIGEWLMALDKNIESIQGEPIKEVLNSVDFPDDPPKEDDILQLPRRVVDFRRVLVAHENIGVKSANSLWEYTEGNPWGCIEIITGCTTGKVKGIGKKTVERNRELWGLEPGMKLVVMYESDFLGEEFKSQLNLGGDE